MKKLNSTEKMALYFEVNENELLNPVLLQLLSFISTNTFDTYQISSNMKNPQIVKTEELVPSYLADLVKN